MEAEAALKLETQDGLGQVGLKVEVETEAEG